ncbi:uncharacterized protein LOC144494152 [Mustelus asterias]
MGGGGSKWRKVSVGEPEPGEGRKESATESRGDTQPAGQEGKSGGGQQRPATTQRREGGNWQQEPGTRSENSWQSPAEDGSIDQELDEALAESQDCCLQSGCTAEPGCLQPPNTTDRCSEPLCPCSETAFNPTPAQLLGAKVASRKQCQPLLGSLKVPASERGEGELTTPNQALSNSKLINHSKQRNPAPDLFIISTQDIENNNLANGCHNNGKNTSLNSIPILYDYSEEELMASIVKEYS